MFSLAGEVLENTISKIGLTNVMKEKMALVQWASVVGEKTAQVAKAVHISQGILTVITDNSVWSTELSFYKKKYIAILNQQLGGDYVKDIQFKLKGRKTLLNLYEEKPPVPAESEKLDFSKIGLDTDTLKEIDDQLKEITDEDVRKVMRNVMIKENKIKKWKGSRGFQPCVTCGALTNSTDRLCPICRRI